MIFKVFLLITTALKTIPTESFKDNMDSCNEVKRIFDIKSNIQSSSDNPILKTFQKLFKSVQNTEKLEQDNFLQKHFIFGNKTELLLSTVFEKIFFKLADLRNTKLNEVVLALRKEKSQTYEYRLLNAFNIIYNASNANRNAEIEKLLKTALAENNYLNIQNENAFLSGIKTYYNYGYFEHLSEKELKDHAAYLICAFLTLANLSSDYYFNKELLQPLEEISLNDKSSLPMLIFLNKLLTTAMEGNGDDVNIYRSFFTEYVINQLQTVDSFNISELFNLENKTDLETRNEFEKLQRLHPEGILTLALDWRLKFQNAFEKNKSISEYFHMMDETFWEALENRDACITVGYRRFAARNGAPTENMLLDTIRQKVKQVPKKRSRMLKMLGNITAVLEDAKKTPSLLQFIDEFLDRLNSARINTMPAIYNYMARELHGIEPFNSSILYIVRHKRIEELSEIVNQYISKDPRSITTMALDWLFDLRIKMIELGKTNTLYTVLKNTFKTAKQRRKERLKKYSHNASQRGKVEVLLKPVRLSEADSLLIHKALGMRRV